MYYCVMVETDMIATINFQLRSYKVMKKWYYPSWFCHC